MLAPATQPDWLDTFRAFTWMHFVGVSVFALGTHAAILYARRHRGTPRERSLRRVLCGLVWLAAAANVIWYALPMNFAWEKSLPLQLCDLSVLCAALALGPGWRWSRTLLFFWGLLLSSQGLITPTLEFGPAHPRFWLFWSLHFAIVGSALYDLVALGYRPGWRDLRLAWIASLAYGVVVSALNIPFHFNYGYIGPSKPTAATVIDTLGPWPLRIVWVALIVLGMQAIAWAGFAWAARASGKKS
ncbi:MAG: TIGR02206 family membrane protein [Phycisphaerales bacterium]